MALRAVPEHPKFACLKALLGQPKGATVGWLEMIWHFTGRFAPQGNIGKYDDRSIETWIEWNGEPGALITAMVKSGWLDEDPVHRLCVHDWHQHADKACRAALKRSKLSFCSHYVLPAGEQSEHIAPKSDDAILAPGTLPVPVPVPVPDPVPVLKSLAPAEPAPDAKQDCIDCGPGPCDMNCGPTVPAPTRVEKALSLVPPKIAKQVSTPDARFTPFREEIARFWELTNPSVPMPWDGSEAKRLNEWLKACPTLTLEGLRTMLSNRAQSAVVQSHRPRLWIASLTDYANGPVDRYGKPAVQARAAEASAGTREPEAELEQLYPRAVELVFAAKPTTGVLQRGLRIGYWGAVHLLDLMEQRGLISAPGDDTARTLLEPPAWLKLEAVQC
jgi:hypothetical protein